MAASKAVRAGAFGAALMGLGAVALAAGPQAYRPQTTKPAAQARHPIIVSGIQPLAPNTMAAWTPEQQEVGYRSMERIFPGHLARRGEAIRPLPEAGHPLPVAFTHKGEAWTTDRFMVANRVAGLLVLHDGQIVLERYRLGFQEGHRWASFSMAKSITSALVGAALKQGHINSLDDPVTRYMPDLRGSAFDGVALRHLLTMTSGVSWSRSPADPNADNNRYMRFIEAAPGAPGAAQVLPGIAKSLMRAHEPGTTFSYKAVDTALLGEVLRVTSGQRLDRYLSQTLWAPLGMEEDAFVAFRSPEPGADAMVACCMAATLRDYGRFGQFMLDGGRIDGRAVLPEGWLKEMTTPTDASRAFGYPYGYQWWLYDGGRYEAMGAYGQFLHVDPRHRLVIVTLAAWPEMVGGERAERQQAFHQAVIRAVSGGAAGAR